MTRHINYEPELLDGLEGDDCDAFADLHSLPSLDREAYKGQYRRIVLDGGIENIEVINKVQSPGKLFFEEDEESIGRDDMPEFVDMNGFRFYWVTADNAEMVRRRLERGEVDALYLSRINGVGDNEVNLVLQPTLNLRALSLSLTVEKSTRYDLSVLLNHPQLEYVSWDEPPTTLVPLGSLKNLRKAAITWSSLVRGLSELDQLEWLRLSRYKAESGGLDELASLQTLIEMDIVQGSLLDLSALRQFARLKRLSIAYVRSAIQLGTLESDSLETVELDHCPALAGILKRHSLPSLIKVYGDCAPRW